MPASQVVTSQAFASAQNQGLAPEQFRLRFLVEGDSWMDRSNLLQPSLPEQLARAYDLHGNGPVLLISCAHFGDTIENMGRVVSDDFGLWLDTVFPAWKFDAVLLSGGGNDLIDAARDPAPGAGILRDLRGAPAPADAAACIRDAALAELFATRMDPGFARLYDAIQDSPCANLPVFLNSYDFCTPRPAPATPGGQSWLHAAFVKNGIPPALRQELADLMFVHLQTGLVAWTQGRPHVHLVPTMGTLDAAAAGTTGNDADCLNEIHPNTGGWRKLAEVWHTSLSQVLG